MIPRKALERITFIIVFILCLLGIYLSQTNLKYFESVYVGEDGLLEWLTVVALTLGATLCIYRARILKPFRNKKFSLALYFMAFVFFFGLMEEISWGQRIWSALFDFHVPEFFQKYNTQGETNFHNLRFGTFRINKIIFGTFLGIAIVFYFLFLPSLYKRMDKVRMKVDAWGLPLPKVYHIISYVALAVIAEFIAGGKKGEILEFGGSWIVLLMFFEPKNRTVFSRRSIDR